PAAKLSGRVDVAFVAAEALFGSAAGRVVSGVVALGLISAVGAMVMAGPRIYATMGEDFRRLAWLNRRGPSGAPTVSIAVQSTLSLIMLATASFDTLLTYVGLTLSLMSALTVSGLFVLRYREPNLPRPYRTLGYPITPLLFIGMMTWMIVHSVLEAPVVGLFALGTIGSGLVVYWLARSSESTSVRR
ncbi:MAG: APA family basic amino acid/polyamine antiporter, partial [Myxococcota bacterium]